MSNVISLVEARESRRPEWDRDDWQAHCDRLEALGKAIDKFARRWMAKGYTAAEIAEELSLTAKYMPTPPGQSA